MCIHPYLAPVKVAVAVEGESEKLNEVRKCLCSFSLYSPSPSYVTVAQHQVLQKLQRAPRSSIHSTNTVVRYLLCDKPFFHLVLSNAGHRLALVV